ncbi:NUDIX hydrolase [Halobacteriales archaeon SW_7_68_16]|nr:MAG: NUDIX hydrolase [Halobacteriales archaeon SW_7_68_16]
MTVDELWYLADEGRRRAQQLDHRLRETDDPAVEFTRTRRVSRDRFRTLARRIEQSGTPFGAHTVVTRGDGAILLCYHEYVEQWVLPGGEVDGDETVREAARRELREEAGIDATYHGLAMLARVEVESGRHRTWGVLPVFAATAETTAVEATDPEDEITRVEWFHDLPADTRDREELLTWRERTQS